MDNLSSLLSRRAKPKYAVIVLTLADAIALLAAMVIALRLRFDTQALHEVLHQYLLPHIISIPLAILAYIAVFHAFRLYQYAWRFASLETVWAIVFANSIGLISLVVIQYMISGSSLPRSVLVIFWMLSILLIGSERILLRLLSVFHAYGRAAESAIVSRRAIILGGGIHGARVLRSIHEDPNLRCDVVGFLDDHRERHGIYIGHVKVLGSIEMLRGLLERNEVDIVIVALPTASGEEIREHVLECRKHKVAVKVIPRIADFLSGRAQLGLEDFSVEDLLRRAPVSTDMGVVGRYVEGKCVLVTGAGGSIGSELCRQIIEAKPRSLILLGHGENSVFNIRQELCREHPDMVPRVHWVICSIANDIRLKQVFELFKPDVVFHAAAHKHVPIMESNIIEAIHNNVIGTSNVADVCGRSGVRRMVLISTDKAADPTSIMGTSKWLCEQVVHAAADTWTSTTFVTVRFGNVLGSRGSVVPLFKDQIARGGPVTVTHPEMTRYFMTIPEAAQLVLQAGSIGNSGDLYLLDMGHPVRILDLAKDMIRLSGFEPDVDIRIAFTGVRPGEKLHEQLATDDATIEPAPCKGVSIVVSDNHLPPGRVVDILDDVRHIITYGNDHEMREYLAALAPGLRGAPRSPKLQQPGPRYTGAELERNSRVYESEP